MTVGLNFRHSNHLFTNQSKAALNPDCTTALLLVEKLGEGWISHPARLVLSYLVTIVQGRDGKKLYGFGFK